MTKTILLLSLFSILFSAMVKAQVTAPPETLTQWLSGKETTLDPWYKKYIDCDGLPIVASEAVSDSALVQACYIARTMLKRIPEAREEMIRCHFRIGVVGYKEKITDLPECKMMKVWWPDTDWDKRGRGYGATMQIPVMSIGEENLVLIPGFKERYRTESIIVHEFAHNVDFALRRVNKEFADSLKSAFRHAKRTGLWEGSYSMSNDAEYFAEGAQAWFNTCRMVVPVIGDANNKRYMLKKREQLKEYDPQLYNICKSVFPDEYLKGYHFDYE